MATRMHCLLCERHCTASSSKSLGVVH